MIHQRRPTNALLAAATVAASRQIDNNRIRRRCGESQKGGAQMGNLPRWTREVSERVMDAQSILMDVVDADGIRTPHEQQALDVLHDTQQYIQVVDHEITTVDESVSDLLAVMRAGRVAQSRRRRRIVPSCPDAA